MGVQRPLTNEQRQKLLAEGYKPVEVWVLDMENPRVREEIKAEVRLIAEADRTSGSAKELEAYADQLLAEEPDYEW